MNVIVRLIKLQQNKTQAYSLFDAVLFMNIPVLETALLY